MSTSNNKETKIPKIIHMCWFSGKLPPWKVIKCILSWKMYLPDYRIMVWDEKKALSTGMDFAREALEEKVWAFAADAIRLYAVYHYGGIYMDTDIMVKKRFTDLLCHDNVFFSEYYPNRREFELLHPELCDGNFWGQEIQAAMFAARKGSQVIGHLLEHYQQSHFRNPDNTLNMDPIAPQIFAKRMETFGYQYTDEEQMLDLDTVVYSSSLVAPHKSFVKKENVAVHCCMQSWK